MLLTEIFQTLEYRGNEQEVELHGPYFCSSYNDDGSMKCVERQPWLGDGYYFWDSRVQDARWWGETVYPKTGYMVCKSLYDQHSELLYDLLGVTKYFEEFVQCAQYIKKKKGS